jgi:hypothetical protein
LIEGGKSIFRLHYSFLPCVLDALHKLSEKSLKYLLVRKLLKGQMDERRKVGKDKIAAHAVPFQKIWSILHFCAKEGSPPSQLVSTAFGTQYKSNELATRLV